MKKIFSILMIFIFVLSGIGAAAIHIEIPDQTESQTIESTWIKSEPITITQENSYIKVTLEDESSLLMIPGKPLLPRIIKSFELPFGAEEIKIDVKTDQKTTIKLSSKIVPTPAPKPLSTENQYETIPEIDISTYKSDEPFPNKDYSYNIGCGLNDQGEHVTHVIVHLYPVQYTPNKDIISVFDTAEISISYTEPELQIIPTTSTYDLVIIAPSVFQADLEPLIEHKNSYGIETILKTTEDIYDEFEGFDKPEQIKYFIKHALEEWGIKYVLLVGGLTSTFYAKARDNDNAGVKGWYIPVRYSNLDFGEPGYPCDLYYADIYKEGGEFEDWDSDDNGILAEWTNEGRDIIDLYPDVAIGRLACRSNREVIDVVNKIINYETSTYGQDWFKKMLVVSGDGFLDQMDLNIQWDTNEAPNGEYTINAQSFNPLDEAGPVDIIHVTKDSTAESVVTFNHDDHLNPALENGYPAPPIAEIVSVSEGDILGNTDVTYYPSGGEAYCNDFFFWANISYVDGVLTIRGKSYDPKPYPSLNTLITSSIFVYFPFEVHAISCSKSSGM